MASLVSSRLIFRPIQVREINVKLWLFPAGIVAKFREWLGKQIDVSG